MDSAAVEPLMDGANISRVDETSHIAAIEEWTNLEELARKEPSLPIVRPRTKRERALWIRVDAIWRALLARARDVDEEQSREVSRCG